MSESQQTPSPESTGTEPLAAPAAPDATPTAPAQAGPATDPVLDEGTYTRIHEPRAGGGLALDGVWHQISPKYVISQTIQNVAVIVILVAACIAIGVFTQQWWHAIGFGVVVAITLFSQIILPRQARALGYMLREDDLVFRRGILWQRMVAVPYGRMQLIDITHGPLDRAFGISKLKMVTAAATSGVEIPGLALTASEALRDTLIEVAETRRTGL